MTAPGPCFQLTLLFLKGISAAQGGNPWQPSAKPQFTLPGLIGEVGRGRDGGWGRRRGEPPKSWQNSLLSLSPSSTVLALPSDPTPLDNLWASSSPSSLCLQLASKYSPAPGDAGERTPDCLPAAPAGQRGVCPVWRGAGGQKRPQGVSHAKKKCPRP